MKRFQKIMLSICGIIVLGFGVGGMFAGCESIPEFSPSTPPEANITVPENPNTPVSPENPDSQDPTEVPENPQNPTTPDDPNTETPGSEMPEPDNPNLDNPNPEHPNPDNPTPDNPATPTEEETKLLNVCNAILDWLYVNSYSQLPSEETEPRLTDDGAVFEFDICNLNDLDTLAEIFPDDFLFDNPDFSDFDISFEIVDDSVSFYVK